MDHILASSLSLGASWLNAIISGWHMPRFWPVFLVIPALLFWLDYKRTRKGKSKSNTPDQTA